MLPAEADVNELTRSVFLSVIGVDAEPLSHGHTDSEGLTFTVDVTGEWSGSIHFSVERELALELARRMLERDDVDESDIVDAMKEVANMIGGNVKGLVPGPSRLSLPRESKSPPPFVCEHDTDTGIVDADGKTRVCLCFSCAGAPFRVFVEARH